MSGKDIFFMALKNLYKRKLRTFLTVVGMFAGTVAIVLTISLGLGMELSVQRSMEAMGDVTLINVYNWEGYWNNSPGAPVIDDEFIRKAEALDGVLMATPVARMSLKAVAGRYSSYIEIMGVKPEAMKYLGYTAAEGRLLQPGDELAVVFGSDVAFQFMSERERNSNRRMMFYYDPSVNEYEDQKPKVNIFKDRIFASYDYSYGEPNYSDGSELPEGTNAPKPVKPFRINVVGLLERGESWESTRSVFMDVAQTQKIQKEQQKWQQSMQGGRGQTTGKGYEQAYVKCKDLNVVEKTVAELQDMGFTDVYSPTSYVQELKSITLSLQLLLGGTGIITLFVSALGITNTMFTSIVERTREIGIMKVIGAALKDIRKMFLLESALIGLFGGIIGVLISYLGSTIMNNMDNIKILTMFDYSGEKNIVSYVPAWLSFGALGFTSMIGLLSGFFPARRAMKISALTAIRTD